MDFQAFPVQDPGEFSDAVPLPRVDKYKFPNPVEINLPDLGEIKKVRCGVEEKIAEVFFLGARENQCRTRIELPGGDHRSESIEIGVDVCCDDGFLSIHGFFLKGPPGCSMGRPPGKGAGGSGRSPFCCIISGIGA